MLSHLAKLASPLIPPVLQGSYVREYTCDITPQGLTGLMSQTTPPEKTEPVVCTHPDMMEQLASYIADEMNRNILDPAVLEMKKLIDYDAGIEAKQFAELPLLARMGGALDFNNIALAKKAAAFAIWTGKVGQGMDWDHKEKIPTIFGGGVWHKQGKYDYFYDIWSNIHYGYVGRVGGFSESLLLDGAGLEQIGSATYRKLEEIADNLPKDEQKKRWPYRSADIDGLRAWDDIQDRLSISIGVKLYNKHPNGGITAEMVMNEVLSIPPEQWGDGIREHKCKTN
ncbi:hypothetical protein D3C84_268510 [compost metagenome]